MESRETPPGGDQLYEARGSVPLARPVMQGDVFCGVEIPGFDGEQPPAVMIAQHPCSMRAGAKLRARLAVTAVRKHARFSDKDWQGYAWAMLLPDLFENGDDYLADFRDIGSVRSAALRTPQRVAAMTNYGVHVLHQRQIYYQTRLTVDIPTLAETFDPIATELELQYEWVEAAVDASMSSESEQDAFDVITAAERDFAAYLDEDDRVRRNGLQQAANRADIRRQVRREIAKRY
jgi:hypothetical protein